MTNANEFKFEDMIANAVFISYSKGSVEEVFCVSKNDYNSQSPFSTAEIAVDISKQIPGYTLSAKLNRYRPGIGRELESIDVYDFGTETGFFVVIFKLLSAKKKPTIARQDLFQFVANRKLKAI